MNTAKFKTRDDIPASYKWSLDEMYPEQYLFEEDIRKSLELAEKLASMQGSVTKSPDALCESLDTYFSALRLIEKAYSYSRMKRDEDNSCASSVENCGKAMSAYTKIAAAVSFLDPEILSEDPELINQFIDENPALGVYSHYLKVLLSEREHTLSDSEEFILASLGDVLGSSGDIFTVLNNVDLDFGTVTNTNGAEVPLTVSSYISLMESPVREVRKQAFTQLFNGYKSHINTIAALYNNSVRKDTLTASLRKYDSCMQARLHPDNIPEIIYSNLIKAVRSHLPAFHKYVGIRARLLGMDKISMFDVYNRIIDSVDVHYTFEEAIDLVLKALAPLGEDYVSILRNGLINERWVDVYENKGKTSGAYSFGSYDSKPYILMNFSGRLRDVFTLIHESGHSMHSYYTRSNQPYIYGGHSIFTAEVASTVNEVLLINYLLDNCDDEDLRTYLINFYIDQFKGTLFRQTMFAEFEKYAHEYSESGGTLTAENLCARYQELNDDYYGEFMEKDDLIRYEWSRIPHFYRPYYVYQYATGFSAANAIARSILNEYKNGNGTNDALAGYKAFLCSGSSGYPIDLLIIAGADMSTEEPVMTALDIFDMLVDELDRGTRKD